MERRELEAILQIIRNGSASELVATKAIVEGFPIGANPIYGQAWLMHAIELGSPNAVKWMISQGAPVNIRDPIGYTPLHLCIESKSDNKYDILTLLLQAGAAVDCRGLNDWTPLHLAAVRNDVRSTAMLLAAGADPEIRTRIDLFSTPSEEARALGVVDTAELIERYREK